MFAASIDKYNGIICIVASIDMRSGKGQLAKIGRIYLMGFEG